jgi:hypothetical protein
MPSYAPRKSGQTEQSHEKQVRRETRVAFLLGRDDIEKDYTVTWPDYTVGPSHTATGDNSDEFKLMIHLSDVILDFFESKRKERLKELSDRATRLVVHYVSHYDDASIPLELSVGRLLGDVEIYQRFLPGELWCGGRLDRGPVTVICVLAADYTRANQTIAILSKSDYYPGIRLWSKEVVDEKVEGGGIARTSQEQYTQAKLLEQFFDSLSDIPEKLLDELDQLQTPVREVAIRKLQPVVRQLTQVNPSESVAGKQVIAKRLNNILSQLGLAVRHPHTGQACSIAVVSGSKAGYFVLQAKRMNPPTVSSKVGEKASRSHLLLNDAVPPIELIEAPRQERFADRNIPGRK